MSDRCKERVREGGLHWTRWHQCSRKAKQDGYCKQHHPDAVKARLDASNETARAEWAASIARDRLNRAAPDLLAELIAVEAALSARSDDWPHLAIARLDGIRAAIAKATA